LGSDGCCKKTTITTLFALRLAKLSIYHRITVIKPPDLGFPGIAISQARLIGKQQ